MNRKKLIPYLYYSIIISSCSFSLFLQSKIFLFRIITVGSVVAFYILFALSIGVISNRAKSNFGNKMIAFYLLLVLGMLVWSFAPDTNSIITLISHPFAFLGFFIAVVALTVEEGSIGQLLTVSKIFNTFFPLIVVIDVIAFNQQKAVLINEFCYFILFEFLFAENQTKLRRLYVVLLMIAMIFISNFFVDRALTLRFAGILFVYYLFYFIKFFRYKFFKFIMLSVATVALVAVTMYFQKIFLYITTAINSNAVNKVDTRTFIFREFFAKFKNDDWIAGRGYLGTYFSPYFYHNNAEGGDQPIRFTAEIGIVDFLLKGGLLLLVPFLLILVKALFDGFLNKEFKSRAFKISLLLLADFFLLSIDNYAAFTIHYMFIWLAVGIIYNEKKTTVQIVYTEV